MRNVRDRYIENEANENKGHLLIPKSNSSVRNYCIPWLITGRYFHGRLFNRYLHAY